MKRFSKIFILALICMSVVFIFVSCGEIVDDDDDSNNNGNNTNEQIEEFASKEEVMGRLKNFSFKYSLTFRDEEETSVASYEDMRAEDTWMFSVVSDDKFTFLANTKTMSLYTLNGEDMSGILVDLDEDFETFEGWGGWGMYQFGWHEYSSDFIKKGTDTVVGRQCNIYEYSLGTLKYKYFIDKEYDMCLKYEITESSNLSSTFAFTEFQVGGVTNEEIMAIVEDYEIDDFRDILP